MSDLVYRVELKGDLHVQLEERGSRRILYLDTLRVLAKESDRESLSFLTKIHLKTARGSDTLSFQLIKVPAPQILEALRLMAGTGRLYSKGERLDFEKARNLFFPPPVAEPTEVFPELVLNDASGCFASLWMEYPGIGRIEFEDFAPTVQGRKRLKKEEQQWEKDLLESGFIRKYPHYYCGSEKMRDALYLLLDVGWKITDMRGKRVFKQEKPQLEVKEEDGAIVVRGQIPFGKSSCSLRAASQARLWVDLDDSSVGLLDRKPIAIEGEWKDEALIVRKSGIVQLLNHPNIQWDESLRRLAEGLKEGAVIETALIDASFKGTLFPYQQKGVDWLAFLYKWGMSALLADDMGLGKTVQVLAFFSQVRTNLPILIVAPTSLLFHWRAEIDRFLVNSQRIMLTSYARLRLDQEMLSKMEFEVVILDESSAIKTVSTQTFAAASKLKSRFKICLCGTPMENRPEELGAQFRFLMPDLKLDFSAPELVRRKIRPFILRRRKEEVHLDLPEKIEQTVWVEMDEEQSAVYEAVRTGYSGLIEKVAQDGVAQHRMEVLEAILRLRQICCDPRLVGRDGRGAKMEQLIADIEELLAENRKVLVFSQFTSMLQLIRREMPEALYLDGSVEAEKRGELVKQFQEDPNTRLFLLSLKAGGVGLNLTAADTVILFDPWWNDAVERQAIDRAHRIGQKKTVFAKRYIVPNSIEEKMLQIKAKKQHLSDQLLDFDGDLPNVDPDDLFYLLG